MSEKFEMPYHDRAVGLPGDDARSRGEAELYFADSIEKSGSEKIEGLEIEKTERDLAIIRFVEEAARDFAKRYGREKEIKVPPERIHLFPLGGVEKYTKGSLVEAGHSAIRASVIIDRGSSDAQFAIDVFHELSHLQGFASVDIQRDGKGEVHFSNRRTGFSIYTKGGDGTYFQDIEEALVGLMERAFYEERLKDSEMFEAKERNTVVLNREREVGDFIKFVEHLVDKEGVSAADEERFLARRQEIVEMFLRARFTGRFLEVARLVEKHLGKGAFRWLAEKTKVKLGE